MSKDKRENKYERAARIAEEESSTHARDDALDNTGEGLASTIEPDAATVMLHEDFGGDKEDLAHDDLDIVLDTSDRKCVCGEGQKGNFKHSAHQRDVCGPCDARILLNEIHKLARKRG